MIVDYHMHLRNERNEIDHTVDAAERFVRRAAERGVDEIGFTEHVYYFRQTRAVWSDPYQTERCVYDLDAYVDALLEAKRRGWPVKLGLELDWWPPRDDELAELLAPYPWDYVLGSVHWVDGASVDLRPGFEDARGYFAAVADAARSGHFDVLAHLDLVKIFGLPPDPALYDGVVDAVAVSGCAVEVSTAGLRKPVREMYPAAALLRALRERGVPITLASDAHEPQTVGTDFDRALAHARAAGYRTVTVFERRESRQEPLG